MSGEVLHPNQEATTNSNGISKDLHNSAEPALDKSDPSAASPVASTFLNSASTTAQASPVQGPSGAYGNSEHFSSETALDRSIATQDTAPGTETLESPIASTKPAEKKSGDFSVGQEKTSKRGSKGSIKAPSRKGSTTSSKLSNKERIVGPAASQEKTVEIQPSDTPEKPKKGLSRFFSILNCCSPSENAHASESNQAIPPKKARTLQANRGRQPTPMTKPNASAGESSNTESKEAIEDNIAGPPYSELPPAAKPKIIEPPKKDAEKAPVIDSPAVAEARNMAPPSEQPLPPLPSDSKDGTTTCGFDEKAAALSTDGLADPAANPTEAEVSKEEMTINDRTPQQETRDIEMPDAPTVPEPQESTVQSPTPPNLPPPPPINRPLSDRQASNGAIISDQQKWLLPPLTDRFRGKKCLVLDLDETLVHSSFKILHQADFTIPVEIEGQYHNVYVIKRPGVDQFMKRVGELYEVVVFTASVSKYGDPLLDQLDIHNVVHHRLFRESCYNHQGNYVKDLSQVGRELRETIIIDNSPTSYIFHPQHAVPISSWFSDAHDNELLDLIPVLEDLAGPQVRDVSLVLDVGL